MFVYEQATQVQSRIFPCHYFVASAMQAKGRFLKIIGL